MISFLLANFLHACQLSAALNRTQGENVKIFFLVDFSGYCQKMYSIYTAEFLC